ncbi:MAG TPA: hypothetical protein H9994_06190 [Candidatus Salinicoccus merdavium]|nr:hypothetical protein [Candidatus Salinicoccus merdavium]
MIQDVWFYVNSILLVIILSFLIPFFKMKFWWLMPTASFVLMGLAGFILPNFHDDLSWQPLVGYAAFLMVISIGVTIFTVMYVRKRKREKKARQADKEQLLSEENNKNDI